LRICRNCREPETVPSDVNRMDGLSWIIGAFCAGGAVLALVCIPGYGDVCTGPLPQWLPREAFELRDAELYVLLPMALLGIVLVGWQFIQLWGACLR